jgi:leader peptidase (prepilin peptidase) / N-methyltransferase
MLVQVLATSSWLLLLLVLAVEDARTFRLPLTANLALVVTGLLVGGYAFQTEWPDRLLGAISGFAGLYAIGIAYRVLRGRVGIGGGDPIMLAGLGAWLGWQPLPMAVLVGALTGIGFALANAFRFSLVRRQWRPRRLPLGTLLAFGALVTVISGR